MTADILRRAAARLRETAAKATPGPWMTSRIAGIGSALHDSELYIHIPVGTTDVSAADGAWIALASPAIAEPLAAWLESAAHLMSEHTPAPDYPQPWQWCTQCQEEACDQLSTINHAVAVARAVLGEENA